LVNASPESSPTLRLPLYYGWVNLFVAALAMAATLPGRTHGLGLITKPLLADVGMANSTFSTINGLAILLGSLLVLPVGRMIDRFGVNHVGVGVVVGLGAAVLAMTHISTPLALFACLLFVRGLGQGALSVVSMAMVGKWFGRRIGPAMGVYSVLLAIGFIAGTVAVGNAVQADGWRAAWTSVGWVLLAGLAPLIALLVRDTPESYGLQAIEADNAAEPDAVPREVTLTEALRSPAFWVYTSAAALFGLIWAAVTLFNAELLENRGFGGEDGANLSTLVLAILSGCGLLSNMLGGWLSMKWPLGRLMGIAMLMLAASLALFPMLDTKAKLMLYAVALGVSGGLLTVVFFAFYRKAFGQAHLGSTQGAGHVLATVSSAAGPILLTGCHDVFGSYAPFFWGLAPAVLLLGLASWKVNLPNDRR
jgi:MFS family permease